MPFPALLLDFVEHDDFTDPASLPWRRRCRGSRRLSTASAPTPSLPGLARLLAAGAAPADVSGRDRTRGSGFAEMPLIGPPLQHPPPAAGAVSQRVTFRYADGKPAKSEDSDAGDVGADMQRCSLDAPSGSFVFQSR
eukprot:gnl/TRDRNA2_/TRDRNA2_81957_c1_seq1.p2 gnl/TRDRNA2_/TRDRNA2_81957_c1~~gnl/TRDRNA2_/TRDRNA2_81957_c1_seq1.p2  ORF type:complete len:137 (+),score=11.41 gnl/TRDRNA2_/TRDRNA2_81957_c1_seq1:235-645(+)